VPYYENIFNKIDLINNEKIDFSRFHEIPILTKEIVQKNMKELISKDYQRRKWYYNSSGGSTGEPTRFIQDIDYKKWCEASSKYFYKDLLNIDEGSVKKVYLWGSPRDLFEGSEGFRVKINDWLKNTVMLNSFRMTEKDMFSYIKTINSFKPDLIRGYASALYELGKFVERNNLRIYQPRSIVSSAETLSPEMREKIEAIFETKVYDFYGSRETASIAGECKDGLIHIFSFNHFIETVDSNNNPVNDDQDGRIIVTTLHNYSMPLIRYEIGDMAVIGLKKCTCGNFLPSLKKIYGRIEEQFIRKDGNIVIGYFFVHLMGVILNKGYIKKFQMVQEDYDKIKILAVVNKDVGIPDSEMNEIEQKIKFQMGQDCRIMWEFVDDITKTQSGKYLYTRSLLKK
jgi:phenylacetate-CoA ligase